MSDFGTDILARTLQAIKTDRVRAHEALFKHRRPHQSPAFHREIIEAFHGPHPRVVCEAFRGAAKSTLGEETVVLKASLVEFKNALLIGASYDRACERLESIGHEFETNEDLQQIFGDQRSPGTWSTDKKLLLNGTIIQARGAGQSLRGVKYHDARPDFVLIDDLEDEESTRTPEARKEMLRWLYKTLLPALTDNAVVRFIGNRLDPEAVIVKVAQDKDWKHLAYPVMHKDLKTGQDTPTWPALFPLKRIYAIRDSYQRQGLFEDFNQEYMCEAETPSAKVFRAEHFTHIVKQRVRTWEATYAMVDPARSIGKRTATTAIPVWSWVGARLVVWDCLIGHWLPDEIIDKIFQVDKEYRPVVIGIEEDALNQFILQPLRQATMKYGAPLPIRAMSAKRYTQGRGKEDFIKSQQPFFASGEVEFAKPLPELQAQFLSFPKGSIDGPNALAYAPRMRPGAVMYEDFTREHVVESLPLSPLMHVHLAMNATAGYVTAVLVQYDGRRLHVLEDYLEEGDPGQAALGIVRRAQVDAQGKPLRVMAPPQHFEQFRNVGLRAALARVPIDCSIGGQPMQGRDEIRLLLRASVRGAQAVQIAQAARWTLNAFAGGYCRAVRDNGTLSGDPGDNFYSKLMEGLESFCALTRITSAELVESDSNVRRSADGRLYRSAMVNR